MAVCNRCGAQVPDGRQFCSACGAPLTAPVSPPPAAPVYPRPDPPQPMRTSQRVGQSPQFGAPPREQYAPVQQPIDWDHLQPRMKPAGATGVIAAASLLIIALIALIWGTGL